MAPIMTGTFAWRPAASAASGGSTRNRPSMIDIAMPGGAVPCMKAPSVSSPPTPETSFSTGSARSAVNAAAPSAVMPIERAQSTAILSAVARSEEGITRARGPGVPADWRIARWKRPRDIGETRCASTAPPPADSPKIVTRSGSPPNAAMLRCTHCSAASWSRYP